MTGVEDGPPISTQRVGELVAGVAGDDPTPGGGAVSGVVAALAAALVGMAGRYAITHDSGVPAVHDLVERSDRIRARALVLADDDASAYRGYLAAVHMAGDPQAKRAAIRIALGAAADVPLELAVLAVEIATAGAHLTVAGPPRMRSDARAAALLAVAVADSAAVLVEDNLQDFPGDPRVGRAWRQARYARAAADRAMAGRSAAGRSWSAPGATTDRAAS